MLLDRGPTSSSFLAPVFIGRFFFQSFFWGIDDLQVIQSLVIKSYFMTPTWDIVGSPRPTFTFLNILLKSFTFQTHNILYFVFAFYVVTILYIKFVQLLGTLTAPTSHLEFLTQKFLFSKAMNFLVCIYILYFLCNFVKTIN